MSNFQVISKSLHTGKRWTRYSSYSFAARDAIVPIVAQEFPRAVIHLPIGFVKQHEEFIPVAVLGFEPGKNLFVSAAGQWIGGYTPAAYRGHPFQLAESNDEERVLVIDEDSDLISETGPESFFDEEGNLSQAVTGVLDFLVQVEKSRAATKRICKVIADYQLIQPWPITVQTEKGEQKVEGLYRIKETAINSLSGEALDALRSAGALPIVYCQLLSMQHLQTLGRLAEGHRRAAELSITAESGEIDLEFLNDGGTISFGP